MNPVDVPSISGGAALLISLVSIAFGLLNCFFGYRIFKVLMGAYGFVLGAMVGFAVAASAAEGQVLWLLLGAVVGGLVGAALMVVFYFVGVFVVGGLAGALLADTLGSLLGFSTPIVILIVVGIVAGIAALFFQRIALIIATSLSGAWAAVGGLFSLISGHDLALRQVFEQATTAQRAGIALWIVLAIWLALSIAGAAVQFRTTEEPE